MTDPRISPLVDATWLHARLDDPGIQIIDATWHNSTLGRDAAAEHVASRIPGAIHLDIDVVAARAPRPPGRMLPSPEQFAAEIGQLGLDPDRHFVVYDSIGMYSAARVWWMFNTYGHERVSVLDGGLPAWRRAGYEVESGPFLPRPAKQWPVRPAADAVRDWRQILANIDDAEAQLVDVRPAASFNGSTAAQYPGVRDGHIPGAVNLSQRDLLHADATFRSPAEIESIIVDHGIAIDKPIIATCGSGVTACILALALATTGRDPCPIYDGSWEEWGGRPDLPAVTA